MRREEDIAGRVPKKLKTKLVANRNLSPSLQLAVAYLTSAYFLFIYFFPGISFPRPRILRLLACLLLNISRRNIIGTYGGASSSIGTQIDGRRLTDFARCARPAGLFYLYNYYLVFGGIFS